MKPVGFQGFSLIHTDSHVERNIMLLATTATVAHRVTPGPTIATLSLV